MAYIQFFKSTNSDISHIFLANPVCIRKKPLNFCFLRSQFITHYCANIHKGRFKGYFLPLKKIIKNLEFSEFLKTSFTIYKNIDKMEFLFSRQEIFFEPLYSSPC